MARKRKLLTLEELGVPLPPRGHELVTLMGAKGFPDQKKMAGFLTDEEAEDLERSIRKWREEARQGLPRD